MPDFFVSSINNASAFRVAYGWKCGGKTGVFIRPAGFNAPKPGNSGYGQIVSRLDSLILGKKVQVGEVRGFLRDTLICDIYYKGKNILEYMQ
ncbi:MAG: hypothetical protein ACLFP1_02000 [Candidatus Goldiibacteriota bacterium]